MKSKLLFPILVFTCFFSTNAQTTYIENFDSVGYPPNIPTGTYWDFYYEIYPSQNSWAKFIPGDGFAYITVDADINNDLDPVHPYQTLIFGGVGENHRLEVRMKGAVLDGGLVAFIFTYTQTGSIFNEVDIELVARDKISDDHEILPPNGWTDARFNTWRDADENTALPHTGTAKAIINGSNEKVSHIDDQFHTYTIDWREDQVDFFIDGVLQESFNTNIAKGWSEVIIGFRNLPWAGEFKWSGTHTLVVDYFKIEPLNALSTNSINLKSDVTIFPNPTSGFIHTKLPDNKTINKIEVYNLLSSKLIDINKNFQDIDVSQLPNGICFLKILFDDNSFVTKKIMKH